MPIKPEEQREGGAAELGHTAWAPREGGSTLFHGNVYLIMIKLYIWFMYFSISECVFIIAF